MKILAYSITLATFFVRVQLCAPGEAYGSHLLRNHGLDLAIDPTVWSRHRITHTFALTTGGREPTNCRDNGYKKLLAAIFCDLEDPRDFMPKATDSEDVARAKFNTMQEIEMVNRWIMRWRDEARARAASRQDVRSVW